MPDRHGFAGRRHGHIEAVAFSPERVFTARLDGGHYLAFSGPEPAGGLGAGVRPGAGIGLSLVRRLAALAAEKDMTLLEINPLALGAKGRFGNLDAKMN